MSHLLTMIRGYERLWNIGALVDVVVPNANEDPACGLPPAVRLYSAPYTITRTGRIDHGFGPALGDVDHELLVSAQVTQDGDDYTIVWSADFDATIARLGLSCEELIGCEEAVIEAFEEGEREACRLSSVRQRLGTQEAHAT